MKVGIVLVKNKEELIEYIKAVYDEQLTRIEYAKNIVQLKEEQDLFIKYIKLFVNNNISVNLYLDRRKNILKYGQIDKGVKNEFDTINMNSSTDLQKIYDILKIEFFANFKEGYTTNIIDKLCLLPMLGENITIKIDSSNMEDQKWFYNEYARRKEVIDIEQDKIKIYN